jgi:hypothetical protein
VLAAGKADDVIYRQKVRFVFEVLDELKLVFNLRLHVVRDARLKSSVGANIGLLSQIGGRREPVWH